jgi:septal ring factor EnvC (AmiA/AmiB activator)
MEPLLSLCQGTFKPLSSLYQTSIKERERARARARERERERERESKREQERRQVKTDPRKECVEFDG